MTPLSPPQQQLQHQLQHHHQQQQQHVPVARRQPRAQPVPAASPARRAHRTQKQHPLVFPAPADAGAAAAAAASADAAANAAAAAFARGLPRPDTYGTPPRRDFIGWVAGLLEPVHFDRWLHLCAAFRKIHPYGADATAAASSAVPPPSAFAHAPPAPTSPGRGDRHTISATPSHSSSSPSPSSSPDAMRRAVTNAVIEHVVLPLKEGETRTVLTTSQLRHVKRTSKSGINFTHVWDLYLAIFDLAEALHGSAIASLLGGDGCSSRTAIAVGVDPVNGDASAIGDDDDSDLQIDLTDYHAPPPAKPAPTFRDFLVVKYHFNLAVDRFRAVCHAVETNHHVRDNIERSTSDPGWTANFAAKCGLDRGQARVIQLVLIKGASQESGTSIIRSHFTVFVENDPLVFAAALSTLDPERAIVITDAHVGLRADRNSVSFSPNGRRFVLSPGGCANNVRKLLYADALLQRVNGGVLSQESFMHVSEELIMLNSGHGAPGSTWAAPWPNWPALEPAEKEVLEMGANRGNIVLGVMLAALVLANHTCGIGTWSTVKFVSAVHELERITELGDAAAPNYLGCFLAEPGPTQNIPEAIRFLRLAVDRGNKNAPASLAQLLLRSGGDLAESVELFKKSIARGGRNAHRPLADLLLVGAQGVPQDLPEAHRLLEEAASLGAPEACIVMHAYEKKRRGLAVPKRAS